MSRAAIGWTFVATQAVLLAAIVLLPSADHWSTPTWLDITAWTLVGIGLGVVAIASMRLGHALTPTPVPVSDGDLTTTGLYGLVRHPIYAGVLVAVIGLATRSGNVVTALVAAATVGFFHGKVTWEERRLAEHYPDYREYAERTPRFVPRPRRSART